MAPPLRPNLGKNWNVDYFEVFVPPLTFEKKVMKPFDPCKKSTKILSNCYMVTISIIYKSYMYRVCKKKWDLFYDQYLHQIEHKSAGYTFDLKGVIHSSVWSTKTFLYHIREPRSKQRNVGYQISWIWYNEQYNIFKSISALIYAWFHKLCTF